MLSRMCNETHNEACAETCNEAFNNAYSKADNLALGGKIVMKKINLEKLPETGNVIIGFSGGADSAALVHFLSRNIEKERILCAHVNHMLRGDEADRDEAAAGDFCNQLGLRFVFLREDVRKSAQEKGMSEEEYGREVRYGFFASLVTSEQDRILTAHHADDQAETIIMRLAQGSGLAGLCGIPVERGNILRPLLQVSRQEIEEYCEENKLTYVTDSTNEADVYLRNKIRHRIVPEFKAINPRFSEAVTRMAESLTEDRDFIYESAQKLLKEADTGAGLRTDILKAVHKSVCKAALKIYFETHGEKRLAYEHICTAAEKLENGDRYEMPGKLYVVCSCGLLTVQRFSTQRDKQKDWRISAQKGETLLPNGKKLRLTEKNIENFTLERKINKLLFNFSLDYDTITSAIIVRNRREGDRFSPAGRGVSKPFKQLCQEKKIPTGERDSLTILEAGNEIVFIEKIGAAEKHKITEKTKRIFKICVE